MPRCSNCSLQYLLNQGDPWVFLLILDRAVFIFPPVAILYFRFLPETVLGIVAVFVALAGGLLYTTPHRYGICVALDWLTRSDDGSDSIRYSSGPPETTRTEDTNGERQRE